MSVNRTATRAGKQWESTLTEWFRDFGFEADRLHLSGAQDEGDILLRDSPNVRYVIEAKREKGFRPAEWIKQAEVEATNYAAHRGLLLPPSYAVISARRNHSPGQAYVITTLAEWVRQISR